MVSTDYSQYRFEPADYRVRIFLSVDLSGSTAFKNSEAGRSLDSRATPKWVIEFESFYRDFPSLYRTRYEHQKNQSHGNSQCPSLWKAVGDELVFCGKVSNKNAVILAIASFIESVNEYRKKLRKDGLALDLKCAAWLAAFPEPNRAVQLRQPKNAPEFISSTEALERAADDRPHDYDFLGKAIDTGFRVARLATPERFVLSVQLARLLASCGDASGSAPMRIEKSVPLQGINEGEPYPVIFMDTLEHIKMAPVLKKERKLLGNGNIVDKSDLLEYLEVYCKVIGTDEITLPMDATSAAPPPPKSYQNHKERIADHLEQEQDRDESSSDQPDPQDEAGDDVGNVPDLNPIRQPE